MRKMLAVIGTAAVSLAALVAFAGSASADAGMTHNDAGMTHNGNPGMTHNSYQGVAGGKAGSAIYVLAG
jgi:Spy/CpxP family protein refolding chaperone